ncbi:hypothetical protein GCM10022239_23400 [Leifsonia bigeumensis]|uniref:TIR domain-containing protein n=1 Tax=Leifsonella bigeumensis TaxID=433643 RepID=A0ABP7FVM4_9MICO
MTEDRKDRDFEYDVVLSFAGEQRVYVEEVAGQLRGFGIRVFYDDYERANLWGKDLYEHLDYIYQRAAEYCIQFVSAEYAKKVWTTHERKSAQARAIQDSSEYILPVRFDSTEIPGLRSTVGYIEASNVTPAELAQLIRTKLGPRARKKYFPPVPDRLYSALEADTHEEQEAVLEIAHSFMASLLRMSKPERSLVASIFAVGCTSEMPDNVHIELDLLRRDLGVTPAEAIATLKGMSSIGIEVEERHDEEGHGDMITVRWLDMRVHEIDSLTENYSFTRSTEIAAAMLEVGLDHYCMQCARDRVEELDFSDLASIDGTA